MPRGHLSSRCTALCQVPLLVGPSRIAGWGAFAPRDIDRTDFLVEYRGELISHEEADRRGQVYDRRASSYLFDLNDVQASSVPSTRSRAASAECRSHSAADASMILGYPVQVVDAGRKGNRSRFANHSDTANSATRILAVRTQPGCMGFALRMCC